MRKMLPIVIAALAMAVLAIPSIASASATTAKPTVTPLAHLVVCNGLSADNVFMSIVCQTDAILNGTSKWSPDYTTVELRAKPQHSIPAASAAGWSSNGPWAVTGSQFCVNLDADAHTGPTGYAIVELNLSWDGAQQPAVNTSAAKGLNHYCAPVPSDATNFWWEAVGITGASTGDAHMKLRYLGAGFTNSG